MVGACLLGVRRPDAALRASASGGKPADVSASVNGCGGLLPSGASGSCARLLGVRRPDAALRASASGVEPADVSASVNGWAGLPACQKVAPDFISSQSGVRPPHSKGRACSAGRTWAANERGSRSIGRRHTHASTNARIRSLIGPDIRAARALGRHPAARLGRRRRLGTRRTSHARRCRRSCRPQATRHGPSSSPSIPVRNTLLRCMKPFPFVDFALAVADVVLVGRASPGDP